MCNPNSSIANRRHRPSALNCHNAVSKSASLLTQNILGSAFQRNAPRDEATVSRSTGFTPPPATAPTPATIEDFRANNYFSVPTTLSALHSQSNINNEQELKPKPRRRRKPQKPGKTAKMNDRHFVVHNYHDHANDHDEEESEPEARRRGGVSISFPLKLHAVLDQVEADGLAHVISWQPHGRCFVIHKPKEFTDHVMPKYFRQSKLTSFQRQLNLYGFNRLTRGNDTGGYYHERFLRGKQFLCKKMIRTKVKGTKFKAASSPEQEPDFYKMPPVIITPNSSDCDTSDDGQDQQNANGAMKGSMTFHNQEEPASLFGEYHRSEIRLPQPEQEIYRATPTPLFSNSQSHLYLSSPMMKAPKVDPLITFQQHSSPMISPRPQQSFTFSNNDFIDEAVDQLFLGDVQQGVNDAVIDFVNIWDPVSYGPDAALENDTQLGNLLDRLLED